ncbi:MAG TPA: cytidylate kinase-like family protein, partial [Methylomirabilota bacterium]|nr:cytidylate kinase-like family protein [Methylomirabilota bacterium]
MAIVIVSSQKGAGGPEIGMALSQRLGYRYVDQELLQDAVRRYGLDEDKLSHLDESKPTFFERFDTETRHHITVLQTTLLELAELDNAVLMRGGGQWLLRGVPHVLRVRLIAPFEHRVKQWIKRVASMTGETPNPRAAAEFVRRDDAEKAGRMRYLYEVDIADTVLYELIINTEMLRHDAVVQMLETLARRPEMATTEAGR